MHSKELADTLTVSILILGAMFAVVIASVAASGWRMTKGLGYSMFALYVLFVAQDLMRNCKISPGTATALGSTCGC